MGEYAEYALAGAMRRGIPYYDGPRTPGPSVPCRQCAKEIRGGFFGMVCHLKAKHQMRDRDARTYALGKDDR
jgi:hypothetical protein